MIARLRTPPPSSQENHAAIWTRLGCHGEDFQSSYFTLGTFSWHWPLAVLLLLSASNKKQNILTFPSLVLKLLHFSDPKVLPLWIWIYTFSSLVKWWLPKIIWWSCEYPIFCGFFRTDADSQGLHTLTPTLSFSQLPGGFSYLLDPPRHSDLARLFHEYSRDSQRWLLLRREVWVSVSCVLTPFPRSPAVSSLNALGCAVLGAGTFPYIFCPPQCSFKAHLTEGIQLYKVWADSKLSSLYLRAPRSSYYDV